MVGNWQINGYVLFLIATAILLGILVVLVWRRRSAPGSIYLTGLLAAGGLWSMVYAVQLGFNDLESILLWARLRYLFIAAIPPTWFLFAHNFSRQSNRFQPKLAAILGLEYILCNLIIWSPAGSHFMTAIGLVPAGSVVFIDFSYGPLFWVHSLFSYLFMMVGSIQLLRALWNKRDIYRGQLGILGVGIMAPWIGNALSILELLPTPEFDVTPFGLLITGSVMLFGLYRYHLLDLLPIALETIFVHMMDGVLVLDSELRIVDSNPAVNTILGQDRQLTAGSFIGDNLPELLHIMERHSDTPGRRDELCLELAGKQRSFDIHVSGLESSANSSRGWLVSFHEITLLKESEASLREQAREIGILNDISSRANQTGNFAGMMEYFTSQILKLMQADACLIFRSVSENEKTPIGTDFKSVELKKSAAILSDDEEKLVTHVLASKRRSNLQDLASVLQISDSTLEADTGIVYGFPMLSGEETLGVVIVRNGVAAEEFSEEKLQVCEHAVEQISLAVARALLLDELEERVKDRTATLEMVNQELESEISQRSFFEQELSRKAKDLEISQQDIIWRLANAGEFRDNETGNHVVRVGYYSWLIAQQLQLPENLCRMIFLTSPLHDIGKIGIPDEILLKPGALTDLERRSMKDHCLIGANILMSDPVVLKSSPAGGAPLPTDFSGLGSGNPFIETAAAIALSHHEHWDGSGYPMELEGEAIPREARIVAVADVFDALTSRRRYKPAFSIEKSINILQAESGFHFDPAVVGAFTRIADDCVAVMQQFGD